MRKDVLFLCQFFYPEYNSSASLPFDTASYLAASGLSVDVLCGYPKEYCEQDRVPMKETVDHVNIHRIRYIQMKRGKKMGRLINYFSFTFSMLMRLFRLRKYRCVFVYSNPPILPIVAVLGKLLFGTKFIFVAYDVYPEVAYASGSLSEGSITVRLMNWLNRKVFTHASRVISLTDEMKDFLAEHRKQIAAERIVTIPNWAHEEALKPERCPQKFFSFSEGDFVVSYFGNMGICQDMETLLQAALRLREYPNIKFLFAGHGSKVGRVKQLLEDDPNVLVLDFLRDNDFLEALEASSCCVVSLEKGLKGTCAPSKYYSYLLGGKPVLVVAENGSYLRQDVAEERIGYAVEIGDVDALVRAILSLAGDHVHTAEMGKRALALYNDQYAKRIGLKKYADLVSAVLNEESF